MDFFYPPNYTGMDDSKYRAGIDILKKLINLDDDSDELMHIESTVKVDGVDAALYLLYYSFMIKCQMQGNALTDDAKLREFRIMLQTAVTIGAFVGRDRLLNIEKFDKMWNVPFTDIDIKEELD